MSFRMAISRSTCRGRPRGEPAAAPTEPATHPSRLRVGPGGGTEPLGMPRGLGRGSTGFGAGPASCGVLHTGSPPLLRPGPCRVLRELWAGDTARSPPTEPLPPHSISHSDLDLAPPTHTRDPAPHLLLGAGQGRESACLPCPGNSHPLKTSPTSPPTEPEGPLHLPNDSHPLKPAPPSQSVLTDVTDSHPSAAPQSPPTRAGHPPPSRFPALRCLEGGVGPGLLRADTDVGAGQTGSSSRAGSASGAKGPRLPHPRAPRAAGTARRRGWRPPGARPSALIPIPTLETGAQPRPLGSPSSAQTR